MIIGNYKMIKQIGEGGFARTYLAQHVHFKRRPRYACVKQNINLEPADAVLLEQEADLLWDIHHYSLPSLKDYFPLEDGSFVMVMDYIKGKDIFKVVTEDFPKGIPPKHVCWITQRLLNATHYLHTKGVIHGDIKPQNILLEPDYEHNAWLVDYGLASLRPGRLSRSPGCTEAFAAPEQLEGRPPIPETDIYGLGVTMIFALGGNFVGKTYPDHVPKEMQDFFNQMVRHDPLKRPKTAEELIRPWSDIRMKLFGSRTSKEPLKLS